jgi:hypothetical protein
MQALATMLALAATAHAAPVPPADDVAVAVERHGATIVVDVEMRVPVGAREAWAVLTDYEHMAAFVSTLTSSVVLQRNDNHLEVEQVGEARRGPLTYAFDTVRAIELVPYREIRSTLIRGRFKSYLFTTRIVDQGPTSIVVHHGEYVPTTWVPPIVGPALIQAETRKQYAELREEMLRRKRVAAATR